MLATVVITGQDRGVHAMLLRMEATLAPVSMAKYLQSTADPYVRNRAKARFEDEGDDVVGMWAPLEDVTQKIRDDAGYGASGPINVRTGELAEYITGTPGGVVPTGYGAVLTSPGTPPSGELLKKVQTAQRGKKSPPTVPRPVMGLNENDLAAVLTSLSKFIVTGVSR